jgi:hypothetical protein
MQQDVVGQFCEWETVTPEAVAAVFARKDTAGQVRDLVPASSFGHAYRDGLGPVTAFRTRRSALGEYQVEGIENDTRKGVGIRYRLVQGPGQGVAAPLGVVAPGTMRVLPGGVPPEAPGASSTLGPEIEREFRLRRPAEPAGEGAGASAAAGPGPMGGGIGLGGSPTSGRSTGTPPGPGLPGGLEPGRTAKPGIFAPGAPASVLVVCREVNRSVADFPEPVDLSTPESACAAWHRAGPRLDVEAWSRLTWVPFDIAATRAALHAETEKDAPAMAAYLKAVADATIVEVLNWGADLAATVTCLPLPAGMDTRPYSARVFGRINGQWKNMGEDRLPTQEAARASFEAKKEALWQQYQDLAEKLAPAAPQPPEGK